VITLSLLHPIKQIPVQVWTFENESTIRIGRSTDNQVILYSAVVSRHHVELRRVGNSWEIVNLGTNGTYLDGKRITQVPVSDGAIIRLARSGPNIQIRIGAEALKDLQKTMQEERTVTQPRPDDPVMSTEITGQTSDINEETFKPQDDSPTAQRFPQSTIPVPPHLRLADSSDITAVGTVPVLCKSLPKGQAVGDGKQVVGAAPQALVNAACNHRFGDFLFCPDCGQPTQVLATLGDYHLIKLLGQSRIGVTYLAWNGNRVVALKTLGDRWLQDPRARIALECEADVLRQINHPRIPHLLDFCSHHDRPLLIMEWVEGESLAQQVLSQGRVSIQQAISWIIELCKVLDYLHRFTPPLLHRGLSPDALIPIPLDHAPHALALVDFGSVKYLALEEDFAPELSGYLPPDARRLQGTPTIDLFSLAPLLAYLISGHNPLSFYVNRGDGYRFHPDLVPGMPVMLIPVLSTITHPDPDQRYASALDVTQALQSAIPEMAAIG
jgi:serine/threonine-protein kinase